MQGQPLTLPRTRSALVADRTAPERISPGALRPPPPPGCAGPDCADACFRAYASGPPLAANCTCAAAPRPARPAVANCGGAMLYNRIPGLSTSRSQAAGQSLLALSFRRLRLPLSGNSQPQPTGPSPASDGPAPGFRPAAARATRNRPVPQRAFPSGGLLAGTSHTPIYRRELAAPLKGLPEPAARATGRRWKQPAGSAWRWS